MDKRTLDHSYSQDEVLLVSHSLIESTRRLQGAISLWLADINKQKLASNVVRLPRALEEGAKAAQDGVEGLVVAFEKKQG